MSLLYVSSQRLHLFSVHVGGVEGLRWGQSSSPAPPQWPVICSSLSTLANIRNPITSDVRQAVTGRYTLISTIIWTGHSINLLTHFFSSHLVRP